MNLFNLLEMHNVPLEKKEYKKNSIIFEENTVCEKISIVKSGIVVIKNILSNGNETIIKYCFENDLFGDMLLFSDKNQYQGTIASMTNTVIVSVDRLVFLKALETYSEVNEEFIRSISNKAILLNYRIKLLNQKSIRSKLAYYLYDLHKKTLSLSFNIPLNRDELASFINVERPSLSRELALLKSEGTLDYNKNHITILSLDTLLSYIH